MTIDAHRLRDAARHTRPDRPATPGRDLWDRGRRRRVVRRLTAGTTAALVLVAGTTSAAALLDRPSPPVPDVAATPTDASDAGDTTPPDREAEQPTTLDDVDDAILRGVAPFDHDSVLDRDELGDQVGYLENLVLAACLRDAGEDVADPAPPEPVDRGDPAAQEYDGDGFPDVDRLEAEGLPYVRSEAVDVDHVPPGVLDLRDVDLEIVQSCRVTITGEDALRDQPDVPRALHPAGDLRDALGRAWRAVLDDIDRTDEVRTLVDDVGACLLDAGVPAQHASTEEFFGHVNALRMAAMEAAGDEAVEEQRAVMREQGQLWAACGRDLFEARERLRGGERRDAFLEEHATTIVELAAHIDEIPEAG